MSTPRSEAVQAVMTVLAVLALAATGHAQHGRPMVTSDVTVVSGPSPVAGYQRVVQHHVNQIRACYGRELARDPEAMGDLTLALTIGAMGEVTASTVEASFSPTMGECVSNASRRWTFPAGAATLRVRAQLRVRRSRSGAAPPGIAHVDGNVPGALPPARSSVTIGATTADELDPAVVAGTMRRHVREVEACYASALGDHPDARGTIALRLLITQAGRVSEASITSDTTGVAEIGACVVERARQWMFVHPFEDRATITQSFDLAPP